MKILLLEPLLCELKSKIIFAYAIEYDLKFYNMKIIDMKNQYTVIIFLCIKPLELYNKKCSWLLAIVIYNLHVPRIVLKHHIKLTNSIQ